MPPTPEGSRLIIHIGTGKTATTSLQKEVFPSLHSSKRIVYLNPIIIRDIKNILRVYATSKGEIKNTLQEHISALRHRISESITTCNIPHLISFESLHGWDPDTWEEHLDLNKELFGDLADSVEIVISVRSTKSYLDSVYMQMIHEGLANLKPETFFLQSDAYEIAKKYLGTRSQGTEIFCIDKLVYSSLFNSYCNSFDACYCFTLEEILNLDFLRELKLNVNALQLKQLSKNLISHNRSYSETAYRLTLARERLLNALGLRSLSSLDSKSKLMINFLTSMSSPRVNEGAKEKPWIISETSIASKFLLKIKRHIIIRLQWRFLMQRCVNVYIPYKKAMLDYGKCDYKYIELLNDAFMQKPISERVYSVNHADTGKSFEA